MHLTVRTSHDSPEGRVPPAPRRRPSWPGERNGAKKVHALRITEVTVASLRTPGVDGGGAGIFVAPARDDPEARRGGPQ
jgi:hypothetical protein